MRMCESTFDIHGIWTAKASKRHSAQFDHKNRNQIMRILVFSNPICAVQINQFRTWYGVIILSSSLMETSQNTAERKDIFANKSGSAALDNIRWHVQNAINNWFIILELYQGFPMAQCPVDYTSYQQRILFFFLFTFRWLFVCVRRELTCTCRIRNGFKCLNEAIFWCVDKTLDNLFVLYFQLRMISFLWPQSLCGVE